jgi:hypothetical protein
MCQAKESSWSGRSLVQNKNDEVRHPKFIIQFRVTRQVFPLFNGKA